MIFCKDNTNLRVPSSFSLPSEKWGKFC